MDELRQEFNNIDVRDYEALHPALFAYVKEQMALPGKQYLLIGDSNHNDSTVQKFKNSPDLAALFRHAAVPHVAVEVLRELAPPAQFASYGADMTSQKEGIISPAALEDAETNFWKRYQTNFLNLAESYDIPKFRQVLQVRDETIRKIKENIECGTITQEDGEDRLNQAINFLADSCHDHPGLLGFVHAGLRVTAADSAQWFAVNLDQRLFLGDRETAAYIGQESRGEKTGVIYGAAHFHYDGSLHTRLGIDKCIHIDIYADRAAYEQSFRERPRQTDIMPDRVYLLKERVLEKPDPALYQGRYNRTGDVLQRFKDDVVKTFGPQADPCIKNAVLARLEKLPGIDPQYFNYVP